jgi:hypothetical protein
VDVKCGWSNRKVDEHDQAINVGDRLLLVIIVRRMMLSIKSIPRCDAGIAADSVAVWSGLRSWKIIPQETIRREHASRKDQEPVFLLGVMMPAFQMGKCGTVWMPVRCQGFGMPASSD